MVPSLLAPLQALWPSCACVPGDFPGLSPPSLSTGSRARDTGALWDFRHHPVPRIPTCTRITLTLLAAAAQEQRHGISCSWSRWNCISGLTGVGAAPSWAVPFVLPQSPGQGWPKPQPSAPKCGCELQVSLVELQAALDGSRALSSSSGAGTANSPSEQTAPAPRASTSTVGPLCSLSPDR